MYMRRNNQINVNLFYDNLNMYFVSLNFACKAGDFFAQACFVAHSYELAKVETYFVTITCFRLDSFPATYISELSNI